jgi:putative endonuclease
VKRCAADPESFEAVAVPAQRCTASQELRAAPHPGHGVPEIYRRFFVYILANRPRGVLYIGVTNDLIRRLAEHKGKVVPGFTRTYGVIMLVCYEEYSSLLEARAREATLKRWRRAWKIELVDKFNPDWRDLSDELAL